ncbi:Probable cystathionine gamma-synthase 2 [Durusdinium trenchii]|uniref:Probable cystathionine gamma-synthase 2 n=1 Tax=Durusdinium trenchii TaxID=1381693 RepID=A0ABP0SJ13_9DINO
MTKYVSAGMCIGGAVLGPNGLMAPILSWIKAFGIFVGQDHCQLFAEGLQSLHARMEATSKSAVALAECLEAHPAVNRVMYPLLPSHPTFSIAKRYLTKGGPGCLWFHVSAKKQHVMKTITAWTSPECKSPGCDSVTGCEGELYDQTGEQTWTRTSSGTAKHGTWLRLADPWRD